MVALTSLIASLACTSLPQRAPIASFKAITPLGSSIEILCVDDRRGHYWSPDGSPIEHPIGLLEEDWDEQTGPKAVPEKSAGTRRIHFDINLAKPGGEFEFMGNLGPHFADSSWQIYSSEVEPRRHAVTCSVGDSKLREVQPKFGIADGPYRAIASYRYDGKTLLYTSGKHIKMSVRLRAGKMPGFYLKIDMPAFDMTVERRVITLYDRAGNPTFMGGYHGIESSKEAAYEGKLSDLDHLTIETRKFCWFEFKPVRLEPKRPSGGG